MCVELTTGTRLARRAASTIAALCAALAAPLTASAGPSSEAAATASAIAAAPLSSTGSSAIAPMELKFSQFFRSPIGPAGLELSDALRGADGRAVRLVGYMVAQEQAKAGRFWLTPRPVRMSEHADGEADDLPASTVTVLLDPAQRERLVAHRDGLVVLTGTLSVGRVEDETGRVSWIRLQLPPGALEAQSSAAAAPDAHGHRH
ncbi:hypothetical protein [Mitsuaria sp. GD03876]|uniref:hypothetical protein n=1 Tax=Mitsuaria sp. GD03876 TaxID=2975399 RepID=UPI002449C9DC|nr:hypothetical protein [Mitsuaria sp. GD03876]MDH0864988.1 hypothetical protein [Mitsuaria sp. GD03876]